jgi:hypothetical protein
LPPRRKNPLKISPERVNYLFQSSSPSSSPLWLVVQTRGWT